MNKSLIFGLSVLLHLGVLCTLGAVSVKSLPEDRIIDVELTTWSLPASPAEGDLSPPPEAPHRPETAAPPRSNAVRKTVARSAVAQSPSPPAASIPAALAPPGPERGPSTGIGTPEEPPCPAGTKASTGVPGAAPVGGDPYLAAVLARIEAAKQYPATAARRHIEGDAVVTFRLSPDGRLLSDRLERSSGFHGLDEAALGAVRQAVPYPKFLDTARSMPESFTVTLSFVLKHVN